MKKSYLLIAAAAGMMLTACSSEDDYAAQNTAALEQSGDGAVLFDTYLSNNNTRAGEKGTMTTTTLQKTGFGIVAFTHSVSGTGYQTLQESVTTTDHIAPNFMWNQEVRYEASNWIYSPLKYWPNETTTDQQSPNQATSTDKEGVSFFAYAPYVDEGTGKEHDSDAPGNKFNKMQTGTEDGIIGLTLNTETEDPKVHYKVSTEVPSESVDLLWGTSSGFVYHPVSTGMATVTDAGLPVKDMVKPALEEKIKFDFKHALARIGLSVVGAFDQKAAGGTLDQHTAITIKSVTVKGKFATEGYLNLNNTKAGKDRAYWMKWGTSAWEELDNTSASELTFSISNTGEMNPNLAHVNPDAASYPTVMGVSSNEQSLIAINKTTGWDSEIKNFTKVNFGAFHKVDGTTYYTSGGTYSVAQPLYNTSDKLYTYDGEVYTNVSTHPTTIDGTTHYAITKKSGASGKLGSGISANEWATNTYYTYNGSTEVFTVAGDPKDGSTYYYTTADMNIVVADLGYAGGDYYTFNPTPGYFMVIPSKAKAEKEDLVVEVEIDYFVTTRDPNLLTGSYKTSQIENKIKQKVTLKDFTNGKAYNLKLILGMTSVKVEAEVSNWEVGTVESNLPQNLE